MSRSYYADFRKKNKETESIHLRNENGRKQFLDLPSPMYPRLQVQTYEPGVFMQAALAWQSC